MANKIYTVVKDGEELDKLKTLAAARKLADEEGGEVYSEGKCVYHAAVEPVEEAATETVQEAVTQEPDEQAEANETQEKKEPEVKKEPVAGKEPVAVQYRLKSLMNVREKPNGQIVGMLPEKSVVDVICIENDWLHLKNGTFILFGKGEFAEEA